MSEEKFTIVRHTCDEYWVTPCCSYRTDAWVKKCPKCGTMYSCVPLSLVQKDFGKEIEQWDSEDLEIFFLNQLLYKSKRNYNVRSYSRELKQELFQNFFCSFLNLYRAKNFASLKELRNKFNGIYQNHQNSLRRSTEQTNINDTLFNQIESTHTLLPTAHLYIANQVRENELGFWESFGKNLWRRLKSLEHLREICLMAFPKMKFSSITEPYKQVQFVTQRFFRVWSGCPICDEPKCFGIVEHQKLGSPPFLYGNCCNPAYSEANASTPKKGSHSILTRLFKCEPHETKRHLVLSLQDYFEEVV